MKILSSILLVAAAANAGAALAPRGKTRRTVLFAVSLATLLALLLPVLSAVGEVPALPDLSFEEYGEIAEGDPTDRIARIAEGALFDEIARRFGVTPRAVGITLPEGDRPGVIRVTLAERDAGMKGKIAAWLAGESSAAEIEIEGEPTE